MRRAFCLGVRGFTSPPIGEAFSADALQGVVRALSVVHAKSGTVIVAEIELDQIAVQMGFANAVEVAIDTTLQDGEGTFNGVRVNEAALGHILADGVID